jgi:hypothetical protein
MGGPVNKLIDCFSWAIMSKGRLPETSGKQSVSSGALKAGPYPPPEAGLARLRQAIALPVYAVALVLSFASDLLGDLAAWIAGDD